MLRLQVDVIRTARPQVNYPETLLVLRQSTQFAWPQKRAESAKDSNWSIPVLLLETIHKVFNCGPSRILQIRTFQYPVERVL
jgi:hypothetical protein